MNELALFAGAGGGILGGHLLGWNCVCAVEYDRYARSVLMARQNDGCLPPFPIWDDVRTFDGRPWRGRIDVVSGGFPCQDISAAGKGKGITGERSGLWSEMARIVGEVRPRFVWVENSPLLVRRGLGLVLYDLAKMGFSARWGVVGARHAGAPHRRDRIWLLGRDTDCGNVDKKPKVQENDIADAGGIRGGMADAHGAGCEAQRVGAERTGKSGQASVCGNAIDLSDATGFRLSTETKIGTMEGRRSGVTGYGNRTKVWDSDTGNWWSAEPDLGRVAHGVAARVDRLRCIGNGQVPQVVRVAWNILSK